MVAERSLAAWWLWCVVLLLPVTGTAAVDPFQVAVPVPDQSAGARRAAEREALERVLVRLTGSPDVASRPELAPALRAPGDRFIRSGYARIRDPEVAAAHPDARFLLELEADRQGVLNLLAEAGIPAWTGRRPEVMVVLLREDASGQRELVEPEADLARALLRHGQDRGLPLAVPLLDLTDRVALDVTALWARFEDATASLARRYQPDAILVLRLYQDALGRWVADWEGEVAGETFAAASEVEAPEAAAGLLVDRLAQRLTARYALRLGGGGVAGESVWLQVDDLPRLGDYAGLMRYLQDLSAVEGVQLVQVRDRSLLLRVESSDAGERLLDLLRLEARLAPDSRPEYVGDVAVWRARWHAGDR